MAVRLLAAAEAERRRIGYVGRRVDVRTEASVAVLLDQVDRTGRGDTATDGWGDAVALAVRSSTSTRRPTSGPTSLTPTERLVAGRVATGMSNAAIAAELAMSSATVKSHLTRAFAKLGVTNRTQLAVALGDTVPPHH